MREQQRRSPQRSQRAQRGPGLSGQRPGTSLPAGRFEPFRLDVILDNLEADRPPGLQTAFHTPCRDLANRFGRPDCNKLYSPADILSRWIHLSVRAG